MKSLLILVASASLLLSCKKNKNSNELVGSWLLVETTRIGQPWTSVTISAELTLTFNNDNTYSVVPPLVSSASGCKGTYRITNTNTVMMIPECPRPNPVWEEEYGFTRDGDTLVLDYRMSATGIKAKYVKL